jgi:hypothetical protein
VDYRGPRAQATTHCSMRRRLAPSPANPGKGAITGIGPPRRTTQPAAARDPPPPTPAHVLLPMFCFCKNNKRHHHHHARPRHAPCQPQQDGGKGRCPVVSNRPLHNVMQQRCHHVSALPGARPRLPCSVPACRGQPLPCKRSFKLPIVEQNLQPVH